MRCCCGGWCWEQHIQQDELWADKITGFVIHTEQWSAAEKNRRLHSSGRYFPSTLTSNVTCVSRPLMWGSVVLRAEITFLLWLLKETKAKKKRSVMKKAADTVDFSYLGVLWEMVQIEMFLSLTEQTFLFPAFSLCLCITNKCYTTLQQKLSWLLQRRQKACQETRLPLTGLRFSLFT